MIAPSTINDRKMKHKGYLRRHGLLVGINAFIALVFLLHGVGIVNLRFVERLENYAYDLRLVSTMPRTTDSRVVILDVDEKSLEQLGHWPWSRNVLADMVDILFDQYKIDVLGFDVVFAEADDSSGLRMLEQLDRDALNRNAQFRTALQDLRPSLDYDRQFADSVKGRRVVLGYFFRHGQQDSKSVGLLPQPVLGGSEFNTAAINAVQAAGFTANLSGLQRNAVAGGFFNVSPLIDADGVLRRSSLLQMHDGKLYESLGLAAARLALREPGIRLGYADDSRDAVALERILIGKRSIPVDGDVAALIPYRGRQGSFPYLSAIDVLQGKAPKEVLRGAIVLVGTTAPGLMDLRVTPVQEVYPGVEAHANVVAGILKGDIKHRPAYVAGLEFLLLLMVGMLLAWTLPAFTPVVSTLVTVVVLSGWMAINLYFWKSANLVLPVASLTVLVGMQYFVSMAYGFFVESRLKRHLANLFGQYVPPELVAEMAESTDTFALEGETRELTVLFSDIRGFTTISEGLEPTELTRLMNEYLNAMTASIHRQRGTIDKYIGDAIMAFWGAPLQEPLHARKALAAALDMLTALEELNQRFERKGWPHIKIGIGINTGVMTVGNMGSDFRMSYTVMGDSVNLGSRLEGLTKEYGVSIIVGEETAARIDDFLFVELDAVRVKGKHAPVRIYQPLCLLAETSDKMKSELADYHEGLKAYRQQQWGEANRIFEQLQRANPDRLLYGLYLHRIAYFLDHPPGQDWDGAFTFTTK